MVEGSVATMPPEPGFGSTGSGVLVRGGLPRTYYLGIGEPADGKIATVDFGPFLRASRHPDLRRYLEMKNFSGFVVEDGQLHWNDFDLIFPLADLYEGKIG